MTTFGLILVSQTNQERDHGMTETESDGATASTGAGPFFCNPSALDETQRRRRALLAEWLQVGTVDVQELWDGYALHLDEVSLAAEHVDEFVALEQRCCPFLRLNVRRCPGHSGPVLEIGGRDGVKAFVASQFGIRGNGGRAG